MSILREITNTVAIAVAMAGLTSQSLAQDMHAENRAVDRETSFVTTQAQQTGKLINNEIPATELQFRRGRINGEMVEITPEVVSQYAQLGQIKAPIAKEEKVVSFEGFMQFNDKRAQEKKAGIFIGVVVGNEPYTPLAPGYEGRDHFRDVHKRVVELMSGYEHADVGLIPGTGERLNEDTRVPGYAELYGAEVQGIIPLGIDSNSITELSYPGDFTVPVREGDILIMINDNPIVFINAEPGEDSDYQYSFPDTVEEMEELLRHFLARDTHRYSFDEYHKYTDAILLAAQNRYGEHFVMRASERASGEGTGSGEDKPDITSIALNNN